MSQSLGLDRILHAACSVKGLGFKKNKYFIFKLRETHKDFAMLEPPNFDMSQQTAGHAGHFLTSPPTMLGFAVRALIKFNDPTPSSRTDFITSGMRFEARACLWTPECVQKKFGAPNFVPATNPALFPVTDFVAIRADTYLMKPTYFFYLEVFVN
jgi:hypothetical protein